MRVFWFILAALSANPCFAYQPYVGLEGGWGGFHTKSFLENNEPYNDVTLRRHINVRAYTGYLVPCQRLKYGLELGVTTLSINKYQYDFSVLTASGKQTYTGYTIDLLGVAQYNLIPMLPLLDVVGKVGVARVTQYFNGQARFFSQNFGLHKTDIAYEPILAAGFRYHFTPHCALTFNAYHVFGNIPNPTVNAVTQQNTITDNAAINLFLFGFTYNL